MEEETDEEQPIFLGDTTLFGSEGRCYTIVEQVGDGLVGQVFSAWDEEGNDVAVKVLKPDMWNGHYSNFLRSANMLGEMEHNNIVGLVDGPFEYPTPFYVMEFVPQTLDNLPVSDPLFRKVMTGITRFIKYMHLNQGMIYADLKGANIGFDDEVKILDIWGVPIESDGREERIYTTGECAPPEYQEDNKKVFPAMDIYMAGMALADYLMGGSVKDKEEVVPTIENTFNLYLPGTLKDIFKWTLHPDWKSRPDAMTLGKMVKAYIKETKHAPVFGNEAGNELYHPSMDDANV